MTTYRWFLAGWAKRLSWGLANRNLEGIEAIGVDEVQWQKGHKCLTLVYQIDNGSKRSRLPRQFPPTVRLQEKIDKK